MADNPFRETAELLESAYGPPPRRTVYLGYVDTSGEITVVDPDNSAYFLAREANGQRARVRHRGAVPPTPDLPVEVIEQAGELVIFGLKPVEGDTFLGAFGGQEGGLISHQRGSGNEFPIDPRLLTPLQARLEGGLSVYIAPGLYLDNGAIRYWPGKSITLTATGASTRRRWAVITITNNAETVTYGSDVVATIPPMESEIADVAAPWDTETAVLGVTIENGQTELSEWDLVALQFMPKGGAGGGGYTTIKDETTTLTQRNTMAFVGAGVTATDSGGETVVTIPGNPLTVREVDGTPSVNPTSTIQIPNGLLTDNGSGSVTLNFGLTDVQEGGVALTRRTTLNVIGNVANIDVADDAGNARTNITLADPLTMPNPITANCTIATGRDATYGRTLTINAGVTVTVQAGGNLICL